MERYGHSFAKSLTMTPEERERMYEICAKLQVEQDHTAFTRLMTELNNLLERKEHRLEQKDKQAVSDRGV